MQHDTSTGNTPVDLKPNFAPLVTACNAFGIGRTKAFELAAAGIIETFAIGTRKFVVLESLRTLPDRLREKAA